MEIRDRWWRSHVAEMLISWGGGCWVGGVFVRVDLLSGVVQRDRKSGEYVNLGMGQKSVAYDPFGLNTSQNVSQTHSTSSFSSNFGFEPTHSSTPTRASKQNKHTRRPIRLITVNCCSVVGKTAELAHLIDSTRPDIILGTESWLTPNVSRAEVFTRHYTVHRRDRKGQTGGGVFIAVHEDLTSSEDPELAKDSEILWCRIKLRGCHSLLVGCFYHPHTHNTDSMKAFVDSTHLAATTRNATVILSGDFHLPGWHWPTKTLKAGAPYPIVHRTFMDTVNDLGWEQVVPVPTRGENFLDLFLTDHPNLVQRTENLPGLADHDAVYTEFQIHPPKKCQPQRQIPLYNEQCIEALKQAATKLDQHTMATFNEDGSVEAIWTELCQGLIEAVAQHVPHKTAKSKRSLPWIDRDTRKLRKRRDCIPIIQSDGFWTLNNLL